MQPSSSQGYPMKLYVCYGTWKPAPRPAAIRAATPTTRWSTPDHEPEVIRSYGLGMLPDVFNRPPDGARSSG